MRHLRHPQRPNQLVAAGGGLGDPFADQTDATGLATITHGPYLEQIPIAGLTVATIRRRFRDRYNIPGEGLAMLDGAEVTDEAVVREGQVLTFMHRLNVKGANVKGTGVSAPAVAIEGDRVVVTLPEGQRAQAPLAEVVPALAPRWFGGCIWPDGVKLVSEMSHGAVVVHQTPARAHNLDWIANESRADFGKEAKYRRVRVSLPYVIVIAAYRIAKNGSLQLSAANECFFINAPLGSIDTPLCYPALLNISKMSPSEGVSRGKTVPLAWICTQNLDRSFGKIQDTGQRSRAALFELIRHMFQDSFNRSSEHHEGGSWFGETVKAGVDERLASIEAWEAATGKDPMFATDVNWLPTRLTLRQVMERMARYLKLDGPGTIGAADLARVVVHSSRKQAAGKTAGKTAEQAGGNAE